MCVHWVTHASEGNHRWWCRANPGVWNTLAAEVHTVGARLHINQSRSRPGRLANQIARIEIAFRFRPIRSGFTGAAAQGLAGIFSPKRRFSTASCLHVRKQLAVFWGKEKKKEKRSKPVEWAGCACYYFLFFFFQFISRAQMNEETEYLRWKCLIIILIN